jgi:hypothetical protein
MMIILHEDSHACTYGVLGADGSLRGFTSRTRPLHSPPASMCPGGSEASSGECN